MAVSIALLLWLAGITQTSAGTGAVVSGRVVDAVSARPIPGAIVTVNGSAVAGARSSSAPASLPPRVMTNATGAFVIRGLNPGTLFLYVTKGGYVDATLGQRRPGGSTQPLQVRDGQRIDKVAVRMWRTAAIAGTIVDEAGEPIVGARVQAFRRAFVAGRPHATAATSGTTDDRGAYRLATLTPGDYLIAVVSSGAPIPGGILASGAGSRAGTGVFIYPTTFYPAAQTAARAAAVAVTSGEERLGVDIRLQPARAVRVSGTVMAPAGFAGSVPVRLARLGTDDLILGLDSVTAVTIGDGSFAFPLVPAGTYTAAVVRLPRPPADAEDTTATIARVGAIAVKSSAMPSVPAVVPPPIPADATLCAQTVITVEAEDVPDVTLLLRPGARVTGRIAFDGAADPPDDVALANLRIALDPADGSTLPEHLGFVTGRVDPTGAFTTYGVPPGKYFVRVSGISGWFFAGALHGGKDLADEPIDLDTADIGDVVLRFTDRPASLSGTARTGRTGDGTAVVLAFPVDARAWLSTGMAPRRLRTARAAEDGSYVFPALPPGPYYVVAVKEDSVDDWQDPAFLESLSRAAAEIVLGESERKTQDLRTAGIR